MYFVALQKIGAAWAIIAVLALTGCGGGGSVTSPIGVTSTSSTSQELTAGATYNVDAAEAWTLAAESAEGSAQFARALVTETLNAGSGSDTAATLPPPPTTATLPAPPTTVENNGPIATSFGTTKLDHFPLDAQNVRPQLPQRPQEPKLTTCTPSDSSCQSFNQRRIEEYQYALHEYQHERENYTRALRAYNAGQNWQMVKEESGISSRDKVLEMLRESAFVVQIVIDPDGEPLPIDTQIDALRSPRAVRFDIKTPRDVRAATLRAIDNINAWLPWEKHITVGNDADFEALGALWSNAAWARDAGQWAHSVWRAAWEQAEVAPSRIVDAVNEELETAINHRRFDAEQSGTEFSLSHPTIVAVKEAVAEVITIYESRQNSQAQLLSAVKAGLDKAKLKLSQLEKDFERLHDAFVPWNIINLEYGLEVVAGCGVALTSQIKINEGCGNTNVIQHELLHTMGVNGGRTCHEEFGADCNSNSFDGPMYYYSHVPVSKFPKSTMAYASPYDDTHGLSQIDGEVIQAIYASPLHAEGSQAATARIESEIEWPLELAAIHEANGNSDLAEDIRAEVQNFKEAFATRHVLITHDMLNPDSLGPWDDAVVRYGGRFNEAIMTISANHDESFQASFGVDWRNGIARPWADGFPTQGTFAGSGLYGSATWTGELVGFTPRQEAVHGVSALRVNIVELTGSATFTELEHWVAGAPPGTIGTGMQWGDGNLAYLIEFDGNYLRSTAAGDEGYVSGRFVGEQHEGVIGILEHPDLAASWGGAR